MFLKIISFMLPWALRRRALQKWFGYEINPSASISRFSWIFPRKLIMEEGARIANFNIAIHLDEISMGKNASIARGNWITGFPSNTSSKHFQHQPGRRSVLAMGEFAAVTKNHHFDCTNRIEIGRFSTIAGYNSQFLTHSIDLFENRQDSGSILIGEYCFVGTNVVVLGNSALPDYSVLAAKSLLNKVFADEWVVYGGLPAKSIAEIAKDAKYFSRSSGFVY